MPKVSIIMSVFREPIEWIEFSINSILEQTYGDFEFIIVNDNPDSDELRLYLQGKALSDKRIVLISNEQNIGLTKSLNVALGMAKGDYIARMDADDISFPERLSKQVCFLESHSEISVVHCNYSLMDEDGKILKQEYHSFSDFDLSYSVWNNPIAHSTVMYRSALSCYREPLYNEDFKSAQDYELWSFLYMYTDVHIEYINDVLLNYRISRNQVSRTRNSEQISNAKLARRLCILAFMSKICQLDKEEDFDIKSVYQKLKTLRKDIIPGNMEWAFFHLLYLIYYNLADKNIIYAFRYMFDTNGLIKYFGLKQSLFVLAHPFIEKNNWSFFKL